MKKTENANGTGKTRKRRLSGLLIAVGILAGIVLLIAGSVCMCLLWDIKKKGGERK